MFVDVEERSSDWSEQILFEQRWKPCVVWSGNGWEDGRIRVWKTAQKLEG